MSTDIPKRIPAKCCYSHIGGKLGSLMLEQFIANGWLEKEERAGRDYYVTEKGQKALAALGIDLSRIRLE